MENKFTHTELMIAKDALQYSVRKWWYWMAFAKTIDLRIDAPDYNKIMEIAAGYDKKIKAIQNKMGDLVKLPEGYDSQMKEAAEIRWDVKF